MRKPSIELNKKVIGTIECQIKSFSENKESCFMDLGSFLVIDIEKGNDSELFYICDCWDGENPQKISDKYVKLFIPKKSD